MNRVSRLNRTAVFVSDLDRSEAFYRDILGLQMFHTDENLDSALLAKVLQALRSRSSKVRFRFLKPDAGPVDWSPEAPAGYVALFEVSDPAPDPLPPSEGALRIGEACLVFYHPDVEAVIQKLKQCGHDIVGYPVVFEMSKVSTKEIIFRDPDGVLINLIEYSTH